MEHKLDDMAERLEKMHNVLAFALEDVSKVQAELARLKSEFDSYQIKQAERDRKLLKRFEDKMAAFGFR